MKVLFLQHVINVWKVWEIKEVKPWYAVNMLFPKKLAVELTPDAEKKHLEKLKREDAHRRELIENRHKIVENLNNKVFEFVLKSWANWKVFGWIWEKDIIEQIKKKEKIDLTKKHIDLQDWHIKKLWQTYVYIKLWKDAMAKITVDVKAG